jgi:hypothetical protein
LRGLHPTIYANKSAISSHYPPTLAIDRHSLPACH